MKNSISKYRCITNNLYFRNSLETFGNRISTGMIKKSYSLQKRLKKYHKLFIDQSKL